MIGFLRAACLVVFVAGNFGDSLSTYMCARRLGIEGETNPIIRGLMGTIGILPTMVTKFMLFGVLAFMVYPTSYWWVNAVVGIPYAAAAIGNFRKYKEATR